MTVLVWPTELKQKLTKQGYSAGFPNGRLKTPMETGPDKLRRRTTAMIKPVNGILLCTWSQLGRLRSWWEVDTHGGVLPFLFPDQIFDGTPLLSDGDTEIEDEDGETLLAEGWWLVQFADAPRESQFQLAADHFDVSIALNVLP